MKDRTIPLPLRLISGLLLPIYLVALPESQIFATTVADAAATRANVVSIPAVVPPPAPAKAKVNTSLPADKVKGLIKDFSDAPKDVEFLVLHPLTEPLLPIGRQTSVAENRALATALKDYQAHVNDAEPARALEGFLQAYPSSAWRTSLQVNLGLIYRSGGYWLKALAAWKDAWNLGQNETEPRRRGLVDRALAEEAELLARLGRVDEVSALIDQAGDRNVGGPNHEKFSNAKVSLYLERTEPEKSFRCGPFALGRIWASQNAGKGLPSLIMDSRCTQNGTSLPQVQVLGQKIGLRFQMAKRQPGAALIVPAVVHWKAGHFAALVKQSGDFYQIQDPTFGIDFHIRQQAFDAEASGYFLVPEGPLPQGWTSVASDEAAKVWGRGAVSPTTAPPPDGVDNTIHNDPCGGMARYDVEPSRVNLLMRDTPLFYAPPVGQGVAITANYSYRDVPASSYQNFTNLGPQWNLNLVSYITQTGGTGHWESGSYVDGSGNTVNWNRWVQDIIYINVYGPGGGALPFTLNNIGGANEVYASGTEPHTGMTVSYVTGYNVVGNTLVNYGPPKYVLTFPNGAYRVYTYSVLTDSYDPAGHDIHYSYDSGWRLSAVTDAMGQVTTLSYVSDDAISGGAAFFLVNQVTDPFGRSCSFTYNASGQLWKITDSAGIVSQFTYGASEFISTLTTPYGNTTFVETDSGYDRQLDATDPMGNTERVLFKYSDPRVPDMNATRPSATGLSISDNSLWQYRNTYYWDKKAFAEAVGSYAAAHLMHWLHTPGNAAMSDILESEKRALESRVYYNYPGQPAPYTQGTSASPQAVARVLDDGSTQVCFASYNTLGLVTQKKTPGNAATPARTTTYSYAANNIDVIAEYQENPAGASVDSFGQPADLICSATYNNNHQPLIVTDTSGQTTQYTYNSFGQIKTATNAKGETTTFTYDRDIDHDGVDDGYLLSVTGPVAGATVSVQYDGFGRLSSMTDPRGYTVVAEYEAIGGDATKTLNRPVKFDFPDGTSTQIIYNRLDPEWSKDRAGRWTHTLYNSLRRVVAVEDPAGQLTQFEWCGCGSLEALIDPMGNQTTWIRDLEGRVTDKIYPDATTTHSEYYPSSGRLQSVTDAKGQQTAFAYYIDGKLNAVSYNNTAVATPGVSLTYDSVYGRIATMTDGIGQTSYNYNPIATPPALGAGHLASVSGPWGNDTIAYTYDELGRVVGRSINGAANPSSVTYDSLGRSTIATSLLGTFTTAYIGVTGQVDHIDYPNTQRVAFDYFGNVGSAGTGNGDRRLKQIRNLGPGAAGSGAMLSEFDYTFDVSGHISTWTQSNSGGGDPQQYSFAYDSVYRMIGATLTDMSTGANLQRESNAYDAIDNRTVSQENQSPVTANFNNLNQLTSSTAGGNLILRGTLNEPSDLSVAKLAGPGGTVQSTTSANVDSVTNAFEAVVPADIGTNTYQFTATDSDGNTTVKSADVAVAGSGGSSRIYDLNGNLTQIATGGTASKTFEWDGVNRLTAINDLIASSRTEISYDGFGRWTKVVEKQGTTSAGSVTSEKRFVWEGISLMEQRDANNVTRRFYFGGGEVRDDGSVYYYTRDHLGSIREITDVNGAVVTRYNYDLWGVRSVVHLAGTVDSDFGFTGHYLHTSSGLYFAPFRAYDPLTGRWISRDPSTESGGINLYGYCDGDPVNNIDRDGYCVALLIPAALVVAAILVVAVVVSPQGQRAAQDLGRAIENSFTITPTGSAGPPPTVAQPAGPSGPPPTVADPNPLPNHLPGPSTCPIPVEPEAITPPPPQDPTIVDPIPEPVDPLVLANTAQDVRDILDNLPQGKQKSVRTVADEAEIADLYDVLTQGGVSVNPGTYPGVVTQLPDGTTVRMRGASKSGGSTIDITYPSGGQAKVHIR